MIEPVLRSRLMRELDRVLRMVAGKSVAVSLVGESGTGKEVLARRIHALSSRPAGPFIPINCAAVPETLFESELFGHERGAFTGATDRVPGKIEAAHGGTLFLDEIGEMPLGVQAKLLRFLETRRFMRVGSSRKITVDARLISATLHPLEDEVKAGRFRADLFYRIQGITLPLPPLRARQTDLPLLIRAFLRELATRHQIAPASLSRAARAALCAYDWPGNVRELRNVIELVTVLRSGKQVRVSDLPLAVQRAAPHLERAAELPPGGALLEISLDAPLATSMRRIIDAALALEHGNRSRAAQRLGVSLRTVQRHLAGREPGLERVDL